MAPGDVKMTIELDTSSPESYQMAARKLRNIANQLNPQASERGLTLRAPEQQVLEVLRSIRDDWPTLNEDVIFDMVKRAIELLETPTVR